MSGFGALDFMNKTLKNNRGLIKKINVFDRMKLYNSALKNKNVSFEKTSSKESIERLRNQTLAENRKDMFIGVLKLIGVLLLLFVVLGLLIAGVFMGKI